MANKWEKQRMCERFAITSDFFVRRLQNAQAGGASSEAVLKAVLPQVRARYSDWAFLDFAEPDIQRTLPHGYSRIGHVN
jgi:hypothetical protein